MSDDILKVTNRSNSTVIYKIPELGIRREFYPKETKNLKKSELEALTSIPGGRNLIYHYLQILDKKAVEEITNLKIEPEYFIKDENIKKWITTCSLDEFKDALDFAPDGTIEVIKKYAIELKLNDMNKRQAMKEQLNFDIDSALQIMTDDGKNQSQQNNSTNTNRRVKAPNYTIVKEDSNKN